MKRHVWAILYSCALIGFTVYLLLDTFVITRVYSVVEVTKETQAAQETQETQETQKTEETIRTEDTEISGQESNEEFSSEMEVMETSLAGESLEASGEAEDGETEESGAAAEASGESENGDAEESGVIADASDESENGETEESDAAAEVSAEMDESGAAAEASAETTESSDESVEPTVTENSYSDANITITITEYREYETAIYVADITVSSAEYLQTAFAQSAYGRNVTEKTSEIAEEAGAILAINGDYYGAQESGYVIRNGVLYRDTASDGQEDLVIYADGSFGIILEDEITAEELLEDGAVQVLSFGPALIEDGLISVSEGDEVGKARASNPRTAIGIIDSLHYVFVVSDGRTDESEGLTLSELAEFMSGLGAITAYNLDGGGSSTMYFNGEVVNNPTTTGKSIKERKVSDIVYIGY